MPEVKVIRANELETESASGAMRRLSGVSKNLGGAEGIHMGISTIPPGCAATPHHHTNCESAIYVLSGHGKILTGDVLEGSQEFGPGDFVYIPPFAVHQPLNTSDIEPVTLIIARNSPVEVVEELGASGGLPASV